MLSLKVSIFQSRAQTQSKNTHQKKRKTYQTHKKNRLQKKLSQIGQNFSTPKISQMNIQPTIFQSRAQILSQNFSSRAQTQYKNSRQKERKIYQTHSKKLTQKNLSQIGQNFSTPKITQMDIQPTIFQSRAQILSQFSIATKCHSTKSIQKFLSEREKNIPIS